MILRFFTYNIEIYLQLKAQIIRGIKVEVNQNKVVDSEWFQLVLEAKEIGIPINEIKDFLRENK